MDVWLYLQPCPGEVDDTVLQCEWTFEWIQLYCREESDAMLTEVE